MSAGPRKVLLPVLLIGAAGAALVYAPQLKAAARYCLVFIESAGPWAFIAYCAAVALTVLLLLPGIALTLGGGFIFGALLGTALFITGEMMGATLAFFIARRLLGPRVRAYFDRNRKLGAWEGILSGEGWKLIALTRLTPMFPFKLSNYFFGSARFRFRDFFWGSLLGTLPMSFAMVYLGSMAADLAAMDGTAMRSPLATGLSVAAALLAFLGIAWMSRRARRSFREKMGPVDHG